jgi:hypothetical protein
MPILPPRRYVNGWPYLLAESDGQADGWQLRVPDGFKRERRNMTTPEGKHRFVNLTVRSV